ncbi:hypothetical protein GR239_28545 [Rhizobium leguminosarum]|jgi:hypothetical protein|uniref:DUF6932 family protein n=1 Tax=Rhizobium TaxID=379 RepID=UPI0010313B79|nr:MULTISPECIES: hypothetical protein [Rhizobium]NEH86818.1 hypothetical protein [Rhizobium ruizarguesonis]NEI16901.1 hypothetical protein [Rhizobium ruizarguesonis]NEJ61048.1 hypothetical protein [Rhizobium ruizarguesonis]NEJ65732.1 hypothetical protein [Rhizobium ruizarguesonis]NEK04485.1 hypothetical protein [Rhizobium ruizarguesonis]
MIPPIDKTTGYLPPGIHRVAWGDVLDVFSGNSHRRRLLDGLAAAMKNLSAAGCRTVLLDGSFVSQKELPSDYDGAWDTFGVDPDLIDPVLLDFSNQRAAMKLKYGGELFPASGLAAPGVTFREFFQSDRNGVPKGVVELNLRSLP